MKITNRDLLDWVDRESRPSESETIRAARLALRDSGDELHARSGKNINQAKKVFRSTLLKSGMVKESGTGDKYAVTVTYRAAHAAPVEDGSRPHMPRVDDLKPWARKKLGDENLAWPVAIKIKKKGTKPVGFMRKAWIGIREFFANRFRHHASKTEE